jgi:hypothetical protein
MNPIIIKGCPRDKWEEVQAIQHEPFIYIMYNGSKWAGEEADDIAVLLEMLATHPLRKDDFSDWNDNVCRGIDNPDWNYFCDPAIPRYIAGPRMYEAEGVTRFNGNFEDYSHAFGIDTNDLETIRALKQAFIANREKWPNDPEVGK